MNVAINGVEFKDIDFTDAEVVEAYENGLEIFRETVNERSENASEFIRRTCDAVRSWADGILGEGAGDKVVPNDSLQEATTAANDLINAYDAGFHNFKLMAQKMTADWSKRRAEQGNRNERRQQERITRNAKKNGNRHPRN